MNNRTGEHDYFVQTIVELSIPFMLSESDLKENFNIFVSVWGHGFCYKDDEAL